MEPQETERKLIDVAQTGSLKKSLNRSLNKSGKSSKSPVGSNENTPKKRAPRKSVFFTKLKDSIQNKIKEIQGKKVSPDGETSSSESISDDQYNSTQLLTNRNFQRFPMFRKQYTLKQPVKPVEEKKEEDDDDSFKTDQSSSLYQPREYFNDSQDSSDRKSDILAILEDGTEVRKEFPRWMFDPNSLKKSSWNLIILVFVIFQSIVIPPRIAFEEEVSATWLTIDLAIDLFFCVDIFVNFFSAIESENGDLITDRKTIAIRYLSTWFLLDLASSLPISAIQEMMGISTAKGNTSKFVKLVKIPRIFRIIRLVKIFKLINKSKEIGVLVEHLRLSIETKSIIILLLLMIFLLHMVGCFFAVAANLSEDLDMGSWVIENGLSDKSFATQYLACLYWAAVTISTVGYGDILPTTTVEMSCGILLVFSGVAMYSYIISKLSNMFSTATTGDDSGKPRDQIIEEFAQKETIPQQLKKKIQYFFKITDKDSNLIFLSKEYNIEELLNILPPHLKAEISYYFFVEAIRLIRILQNRDQRFYAHYILKFEPMRIKVNTNLVEEGTRPSEVFFLLSGCVEAVKSGKYYGQGAMFGESDIIFNRERLDTYRSRMDCKLLRIHRTVFEQMIDEFDDFREDVEEVAHQREQIRLKQLEEREKGGIKATDDAENFQRKKERLEQMEKLIEEISKQFNNEGEKKQKRSSQEMIKQYLNLRHERGLVTVGSSPSSPLHPEVQAEGGEQEAIPLSVLREKAKKWPKAYPEVEHSISTLKQALDLQEKAKLAKAAALAKVATCRAQIQMAASRLSSKIKTLQKHKDRLDIPLKMKLKPGVTMEELRATFDIGSEAAQSEVDSLEEQIKAVMGEPLADNFENIISDYHKLESQEHCGLRGLQDGQDSQGVREPQPSRADQQEDFLLRQQQATLYTKQLISAVCHKARPSGSDWSSQHPRGQRMEVTQDTKGVSRAETKAKKSEVDSMFESDSQYPSAYMSASKMLGQTREIKY